MFALIALTLTMTSACRPRKKDGAPSTAQSTTLLAASASGTPVAKEAESKPDPKSACAALEADKIAPLATCTDKVVKTPLPEIVDPTGTMASFWERLAELERGTATRPIRIAIYGDSNLTSDFLSGHLRRVLQTRYGDAGHGWVSLSRPWGSYRHEDVVMLGFWPMFKLYAPTTHLCAAAWAATTKDPKSVVGQAVSHFELHYLKQPRGGTFTVQIDKKDLKTVDTKAPAFEAGIEEVDVEEGPHELRGVVTGTGPVRFFGVSLDRPGPAGKPGIQVDSLGAGALQYERLTWVAKGTRKAQLEKRAYDLVILWLGMNVMFVPPNRGYATEFIGDLKEALPKTPVLVMGPGDTVKDGETKSDPRIVSVVKQMREVAAATGSAWWDFRDAMGGDGSIIGFTRRGLTGEDHIHFGPEGSRLMGDRFLCAATASFDAHVKAHPDAGCK
jgi:lysophospholipase L1-like esterase